jgi:hypothetical protein
VPKVIEIKGRAEQASGRHTHRQRSGRRDSLKFPTLSNARWMFLSTPRKSPNFRPRGQTGGSAGKRLAPILALFRPLVTVLKSNVAQATKALVHLPGMNRFLATLKAAIASSSCGMTSIARGSPSGATSLASTPSCLK